jgi:hypothetical protein
VLAGTNVRVLHGQQQQQPFKQDDDNIQTITSPFSFHDVQMGKVALCFTLSVLSSIIIAYKLAPRFIQKHQNINAPSVIRQTAVTERKVQVDSNRSIPVSPPKSSKCRTPKERRENSELVKHEKIHLSNLNTRNTPCAKTNFVAPALVVEDLFPPSPQRSPIDPAIIEFYPEEVTDFPIALRRSALEDATEASDAVIMLLDRLAAKGLDNVDVGSLLQWVAAHQTNNRMMQFQLQQEVRKYCYETKQRNLDRSVEKQRHDEKMEAHNKDKEWFAKLQNARDHCLASGYRALIYGALFALIVETLATFSNRWKYWEQSTYSQIFCPTEHKSSLEDFFIYEYTPSFLQSSILSITDGLTCVKSRVLQIGTFVLISIVTWLGSMVLSWFVSRTSIFHFIFRSAPFIILLYGSGWIHGPRLIRLFATVGPTAVAFWFGLQMYFRITVRELRRKRDKSVPLFHEVDEKLSFYDGIKTLIEAFLNIFCTAWAAWLVYTVILT